MIDQDQARKFWTNWVRREIGGNEMIQEAAVSAAVNEVLLGHDNQAAANAARGTAHRLGGGVPPVTATPSTTTPRQPRDAPFPTPVGGTVPAGTAAERFGVPLIKTSTPSRHRCAMTRTRRDTATNQSTPGTCWRNWSAAVKLCWVRNCMTESCRLIWTTELSGCEVSHSTY